MRELNLQERAVTDFAQNLGLNVTVFPTYPDGMELLVVGEASGKQEFDQQQGFVGKSGEILQKIISVSGIYWDKVGKSNVAKRAPDNDDFSSEGFIATFYQAVRPETIVTKTLKRCGVTDGEECGLTEKQHKRKKNPPLHMFAPKVVTKVKLGKLCIVPTPELELWHEVMRKEIELTKPKLIIACGNEALKALCGVVGISKYRGSLLPSTLVPGVKVMPLMHPSWISRSMSYQEVFISSHIVCNLVIPEIRNAPTRSYEKIIQPDIHQVTNFLRQIDSPYVIDIETRAGSIACVGFATILQGKAQSICIPLQTTTGPYFSLDDEVTFWQEFQSVALKHQMIGHNIFYDMAWLREFGINPIDIEDTMLLFHRLYPELPKGLDFVNMWFNREISFYKDDGKTWGWKQPDLKLYEYNVLDTIATLWAYQAMMKLVETPQFKQPYAQYCKFTRPQFPIAFEMQSIGMPVDVVGLAFAKEVLTAELDKVRQRLDVLSEGKLVIVEGNKKITDQQVAKYIYGDMKLPVKYNRKTKAVTADEDSLVELLIQFPQHEVLKAINAERKLTKAINSYIGIKWKKV